MISIPNKNHTNKKHTRSSNSRWNTIATISNRINTSIKISSSNKKTMIKITTTKTITLAIPIRAAIMAISDLTNYNEFINIA